MMKKTITLFMALALVTSLFAVPVSPKLQKQGKEKTQTEQKMEQRARVMPQINLTKVQDLVRPVSHKAPMVKKNISRNAVRKAPMAKGAVSGSSTTIGTLNYVDAYYYEDDSEYYWDMDLYNDYSESEGLTYPEVYVTIAANSKTSIAGECDVYYAGLWTSEKDSVEFASGELTISYNADGTYNYVGEFEDESGNVYVLNATNLDVWAYDYDNDEEITLDETGGGSGETIYEIDFTEGQGEWTINNVDLPTGISFVWKQNSNYGMKASAYNKQAYAAESWLISPEIDLTEVTEATLTVNQALNQGANTNMKLKISTDGGKTWEDLDLNLPEGKSWDFQEDEVDLSDYAGETIMLAFVYVSTTSVCPAWEIKSLSIVGEGEGGGGSTVDTVVVPVNYVQAVRYDSESEAGAYLWEIDAMNFTSIAQYENVWFMVTTPQNNRLEGIYDIESDNIYNFYGYYYYAGYTKVNGNDTTDVGAGSENIQLIVAYDETNKAYDMYGELLSEDGKTLYQFEVEDMDIIAYNEEEEDITLVDSTEFVPDTFDITGMNAIEIAYYASYSEVGAYNYSVNLYNNNDEDGVPYLALDIYTATENAFVGSYDTLTNVGEYCSYYPNAESYGSSVINPVFTISQNGNVYTVAGQFTGADENIYRFSVSAEATMADGDHPYEPMEKQADINIVANSKTLVTDYVSDYGELDLYLNGTNDTIQLALTTSKTTIADGTYEISTEEETADGELMAGYYSYFGIGGCAAYVGDDVYYLVEGALNVTTANDTTTYSLYAFSAHGTVINATYKEYKAGPTPGEHTIIIENYQDTAFSTTDGIYSVVARKAGGTQAPAYVANGKDLRVYANGTLEISATSEMTEIIFNISAAGLKRQAAITPSTGNMAYDMTNSKVTWTGRANKVTFTVGAKAEYGSEGSTKAGQFNFTSMDIKLVGSGLMETPEFKIQNSKFIMTGQLFILKNGVLYNAQGQVVR